MRHPVRHLYVTVPEEAADALACLAADQWRTPKEQATVLILDGLRRAGVVQESDRDDSDDGDELVDER